MSSASIPIKSQLIGAVAAANADRLSDQASNPAVPRTLEAPSGWDAYEVWRHFIKDARDRRQRRGD